MTTFSQLVDEMVAESRRKDLKLEIETYVNQTIRDVHFNRENTNLILFDENRREAYAYADADESHLWPIESPQTFAKLEAIWCPDVGQYAIERKPGQIFSRENIHSTPLYYRTGPSIAISGFGGINSPMLISWFAYPRRLKYQAVGARQVAWDEESQTYLYDPSLITAELQEAARELTTNWLLERWEDLIREGTRAKIYKKLADDVRNRNAYAAFEASRGAMVAAETYESQVILTR